MKHFCFLLFAFLHLVVFPHQARAQVSVETLFVNFEADALPVRNFIVRNASDAALYVKADPYAVQHAGFPDEQMVKTEDFLVSPNDFSIPPNGERTVRLIVQNPNVNEQQAFRVNFIPQAREDEDAAKAQAVKGKKGAYIKVLQGIGILVFVNPAEKKPQLTWERQDDRLIIKNEGNMNLLLDGFTSCDKEERECLPLKPETKRLYVKNVLEFAGVKDRIVRFTKQFEDDSPEAVRIQ